MTLTLYKFFKFLFRYFIPLPLRYPLGRAIARGVCRFNKTRRETIIANLTPLVGKSQAAVLAQLLRQQPSGESAEGGEAACWAHLVCPECGAM